jgi:hypothetical protein
MPTATANHTIDAQRLIQAIKSHIGRIKNSPDPVARNAAQQLQKELGKVVKV